MNKRPAPAILVLEADKTIGGWVVQLLEDHGWRVTHETVSKQALLRLKESQSSPYHLFISSFKLPKMEGDDILKNAKRLSPLTQRMLLVPANEGDLIIRAINKAEINACVITPASDQDLLDRVNACLRQFKLAMKHEQLKRVTVHQNKQMFKIAQRLKKKAKLCQEQISEKKAEKLLLRSKLRKAQKTESGPATLADRIESRNIPMDPAALDLEFRQLADYASALFNSVAAKSNLEKHRIDLRQILTEFQDLSESGGETTSDRTPDDDELIKTILATAFSSPEDADAEQPESGDEDPVQETLLENFIQVTISEDLTRAFIMQKAPLAAREILTLSSLLDLLRQKDINFGIVDDKDIEEWIAGATPESDSFTVAIGEKPDHGADGKVDYFFETDYSNPGKILEDGRIDFRDRGDIPFVSKGELLATKTPAREGKQGMSVSGLPIDIDPPLDPVFLAGNGTRLSEDGLNILSDLEGQPHLDPLGEVSVNPELPVNGDIDFETGNVDFNGNILVTGTVKEGFHVKGINLTAKEIEGAVIDIAGDLYISDGITDAKITSRGSVFAKFINNSQVTAFGDLVIQKEIIDSKILLSGRCENPAGVILASKITAKSGIEAGKIGTDTSKPALLRIGVDDHLESQTSGIEKELDASVTELGEIREEIKSVEAEDQDLYGQITEKAQAQEAAQNRIREAKKELDKCKKAQDEIGISQAVNDLKTCAGEAEQAENDLNQIFETQDRYARKIERLKERVNEIEEANKTLVLKKKGIREFAKKTKADPSIIIKESITQDTEIRGPNAALTLLEPRTRCRIAEKDLVEDGLHFYEMEISDL